MHYDGAAGGIDMLLLTSMAVMESNPQKVAYGDWDLAKSARQETSDRGICNKTRRREHCLSLTSGCCNQVVLCSDVLESASSTLSV